MAPADHFAALLAQHQGILAHVSRLYARTPAEREDLAQEVALQLWRSFPTWDPARKFSTWMYRIALNVAISRLRQPRPAFVPLSDGSALLSSAPLSPELDELYRLIQQLPPLDRSLVLLYLEGHSFAEIADILGITPTNASTKLTRIKQAWKGNSPA